MNKYLILGNGFIGNKFLNYLKDAVMSQKRIETKQDVLDEIKKYRPRILINCIGKNGTPNIDWCETHKEETFFANFTVPIYIANACKETNIFMVHISSGCIYNGYQKIFSEDDEPNFVENYYSQTKWAIEQSLKYRDVLLLRIRMPIDSIIHPRNLITKLINFDYIIDTPNSVTIIKDFLVVANQLMDMKFTGIFNIVNKGGEFHKDIIKLYGKKSKLMTIEELNNKVSVKRSNCLLSTKKLDEMGITMPDFEDSMKQVMKEYKQNELNNVQIERDKVSKMQGMKGDYYS